ncbi:competence/damage-inducible protein A [bacterium]|nr:competence/damage-inducible protein A [bacterium]MBU4560715.1 competence/damage-inducible protein A [bacterium]MCG2675643.1 competence/damage-inducible protein A [bacterium]MCG2677116.1 competence/damage-inducible protein A [bacterium]
MNAEIISIGSEHLLGEIVNTDAPYLSQRLAALGIEVERQITIGDDEKSIASSLEEALRRARMVITIGGLGPTPDDLTKKVIAKVAEEQLVLNEEILSEIEGKFKEEKKSMPSDNIKQAFLPRDSHALKNRVGIAPGFILETRNRIIIALPGPYNELVPMFEEEAIPYLKGRLKIREVIKSFILRTTGLPESKVAENLKDIMKKSKNPRLSLLAHENIVDIILVAKAGNEKTADRLIEGLEKKIGRCLGNYNFGTGKQTLEEVVGYLLYMRKKSIAVAESCTGGLISHRLTNVPGSSNYFLGSVVAYSDKIKRERLGVKKTTLEKYGAVSEKTVGEMAKGIKKVTKSNFGLGVTGIAGPTGATEEKPIGLVYIALADKDKVETQEFKFRGEREIIKAKVANAALDMVRRHLLK